MAEAMTELHDDLAEGDAFLHNDPYLGNSHSADHGILVPVFVGGEHVFTAVAKAHQADCGNALPTTYMGAAKDVYGEGALIFPAVKIQSDYEHNMDLVRMCRMRIRVPDQWWGDYLATLGAGVSPRDARAGDDAAALRWHDLSTLADAADLVPGLLGFLVEHGLVPVSDPSTEADASR